MIHRLTSAQANKELKKLNEELSSLFSQEKQSCTFVAATTEDLEEARPEYDFGKMQDKIAEIQEKITKLKHAINLFNTTHKPEGFDMTVDEMLVYIPQLSSTKAKYARMANRLEKTRVTGSHLGNRSPIIEYEYANYDVKTVKYYHDAVADQLTSAQLALDKLNTTETFEVDF